MEKKVEDVVHRAFWDVLEAELSEDPPNYTQAMTLLGDIKNGLLELLLPQHTKIRQQISEVLDIDLIRQQANAGALDFQVIIWHLLLLILNYSDNQLVLNNLFGISAICTVCYISHGEIMCSCQR